jgi:adenylate kinase
MNILIVGPQGSGKGTQAKIVAEKIGVPDISMGGLLRNASPELQDKIDSHINKGILAPPEIVVESLKQRIEKDDCKDGYILDGFPRSEEQVELAKGILELDKVFLIDISDEEAIKRISSRLNCKKCGSVFNSITNLPKIPGRCDSCHGELHIRSDDKPEAIKQRLEIYHKDTEPILKIYEDKLVRINGEQDIDLVTRDILKELE